jgi:ribose transport system permease protein
MKPERTAGMARGALRRAGKHRAWVGLLIFMVAASTLYDTFLSTGNLFNVMRQATIIGLLAAGMTFVIVTRGIDLSVGSILGLSGVAYAMLGGQGVVVATGGAIAVGAITGLLNATIIVRLGVDPFVATIATMFAFRGVALLVSGETPVRIDPENGDLLQMGRAALGPVPFPVVLLVLVYLALGWAARYTRLGRVVHAVGGNSSGAEMMGLPVARAKGSVYVLSGVLASIGGILLASRLGSGQPVAGEMYDLSAIAAVVIGGTLLSGGVGRLSGTFAGVVLIAMIANVFNLQGDLSTWWQNALNGAILLALIVGQAALTGRARTFIDGLSRTRLASSRWRAAVPAGNN